MKKPIVLLLLIVGILLLIVSIKASVIVLTFAAIGILILIAERKAEVLDNWSALIRGAKGNRDQVISKTKELIEISKAPSIEMNEVMVGPTFASSAIGETRAFLVVADRRNLKLGCYKAYLCANDYGDALFVSWYLTYMPDVWQTIASLFPGTRKAVGLDDLNLFNQQDLTAYVTCVHQCMIEAVEQMMSGKGLDTSKIDRRTKGFLGIS
ncbi:MAG: hypothetical protein NTW38_01605 [Candidatus Aminicenantes bacterium]|nr:hypothetical protein [Candidatus Aminicenantes bacterium]